MILCFYIDIFYDVSCQILPYLVVIFFRPPGVREHKDLMLKLEYTEYTHAIAVHNLPTTYPGHPCTVPNDPINGHKNCTEDELAVQCTLACQEGFAFAFSPLRDYSCQVAKYEEARKMSGIDMFVLPILSWWLPWSVRKSLTHNFLTKQNKTLPCLFNHKRSKTLTTQEANGKAKLRTRFCLF